MIIKKIFKDYVSQRYPNSRVLKNDSSEEYEALEETFLTGMYTFMNLFDKLSADKEDVEESAKKLITLRLEFKLYFSELNQNETKIQNRS